MTYLHQQMEIVFEIEVFLIKGHIYSVIF